MSLRSIPLWVSDYILCLQYLIFKQKYITGDHTLTAWNIFIELKSSTLVSYLYGLMWRIFYLISVAPYCNITVPLVKHCVITKGREYSFFFSFSFIHSTRLRTFWSGYLVRIKILDQIYIYIILGSVTVIQVGFMWSHPFLLLEYSI